MGMDKDRFKPDTVLLKRQAVFYKDFRKQIFGDLIIWSEKTVFQPKKGQPQSAEFVILHEDIVQITPYSSLLIIPNGLKIVLQSSQEFRFTLYDRQAVIETYRTLGKGHLIPAHKK